MLIGLHVTEIFACHLIVHVNGVYIHILMCAVYELYQLDVPDTVSQWTPLMRVSLLSGNCDVASLLIQAGADVNVRDKEGKTPLMVLQNGNVQNAVALSICYLRWK